MEKSKLVKMAGGGGRGGGKHFCVHVKKFFLPVFRLTELARKLKLSSFCVSPSFVRSFFSNFVPIFSFWEIFLSQNFEARFVRHIFCFLSKKTKKIVLVSIFFKSWDSFY